MLNYLFKPLPLEKFMLFKGGVQNFANKIPAFSYFWKG